MGKDGVIYSTKRGDGPLPVLILHGFLGSGRNLASLARSWSKQDETLSLILADLPGHGRSGALEEKATLRSMAEQLLAHLETAENFRLVGHSLGGRVALRLFALAPERIERVTILDISPSPIEGRSELMERAKQALMAAPEHVPERGQMREALAQAGLRGSIADWLLMNVRAAERGGFEWGIDRGALIEFGKRTSADDLWDIAKEAGSKLTCIRGGKSPYVSEEELKRYEQLGATVQTVAGAGHFLHAEQPQKVLELLSK